MTASYQRMTQDFAKKKRTPQRKPAAGKRAAKPSKSAARKNTRRTQHKSTHKAPAWAWLIIGLLLGALITLLIYLANQPAPAETQSKPTATSTAEAKPPQPRFDFYQILKEQEIEVPDRSSEIAASTPENITYFLQAGSFKKQADAERLRAELLLINLEANIESANNKGSTWHRVIVGPFKSRSRVAKARSTLASQNLRPLLLKRKDNE